MHRIDKSMRMCIIIADLREKGFDTLSSTWKNNDYICARQRNVFSAAVRFYMNEKGII